MVIGEFLVLLFDQDISKLNKDEEATKHCLAIGKMTPFTSTQDYQPLVREAPIYPKLAVERRREGYVILEYDVDEAGFVRDPRVVDWQGHNSFVNASIKAAKDFRYAPAFREGLPVVTKGVQNKFTYELER